MAEENEKQEMCSIRIMFPVESDEKAIEYKKKIAEVLADLPEKTMQFGLSESPHR